MAPANVAELTLIEPQAERGLALPAHKAVDPIGTRAISLHTTSVSGMPDLINLHTLFIAGVILAGIPFLT